MIAIAQRMLGSRMVSDARVAASELAALTPVLIRRVPAVARHVPALVQRVLTALAELRAASPELWVELRGYSSDQAARNRHLADVKAAFGSMAARAGVAQGVAAQRVVRARVWVETLGPRAVAAVQRDIADGAAVAQRFAPVIARRGVLAQRFAAAIARRAALAQRFAAAIARGAALVQRSAADVATRAASALRAIRVRPKATSESAPAGQMAGAPVAQAVAGADVKTGIGAGLQAVAETRGWLDQVLHEESRPEAVATPREPVVQKLAVEAVERVAGGAASAVEKRVKGTARGTGAGQLMRAAEVAARELVQVAGRVLRVVKGMIPDVAKVVAGGVAVVAVIAAVGYGAARLGKQQAPVTAMASPSPAVSTAAAPALVPAAAAVPAMPNVLPLSRFNPVTGPDLPPLPEDANGPQGSLRTTGTYEVALTFDDGPDPRWTPEVLGLLRQYRIKATFCVIGVNVVEFPELVRDIVAEGHTLCNHSWGHDIGLGNRPYATIVSDMKRTNDAIRAASPHARVSYFRHPGGAWTQAAVRAARSLGMSSLHWDVDPRDWLRPGARTISSAVVSSTGPGSIVLMHDGGGDRRGTADALRSILPNLAARFPLVALPPGVDPPKLYGIHLPVHVGQQ